MFIKFPSINSMSNVKTTMHHQKVNTILTYNAKVTQIEQLYFAPSATLPLSDQPISSIYVFLSQSAGWEDDNKAEEILTEHFGSKEKMEEKLPLFLLFDSCKECGENEENEEDEP